MPPPSKYSTIQRRDSIPQELEDLEDMTGVDATSLNSSSARPPTSSTASLETPSFLLALPKELRNMISGGVAGMMAKSVVAPVDRIKILFQVTSAEFKIRKLPEAVRSLVAQEGWTGLWKGNTATMIRVVPYSGIQFMVFEKSKGYFLAHSPGHTGLTPLQSLISGMMAGAISVVCTYPLDLARAQLAVLKKSATERQTITTVLKANFQERGVARGLFRGLSITLVGMLPYAGIAFALNEQTKRYIRKVTHRDLTTMERIQSGALAGLVAQTIAYPLEVTRRRMQTLGLVGSVAEVGARAPTTVAAVVAALPAQPPTIRETVVNLYREQGIRGFYKGVAMNWMKGPIAFSISFTVFDTVKVFMETESEKAQPRV